MRISSHQSSSKRCLGFINHEGLVVGFICALLAALILPLARKTGATWLAVIGGLILLFGLFALISDFVMTFRYYRTRKHKKDSEKHESPPTPSL